MPVDMSDQESRKVQDDESQLSQVLFKQQRSASSASTKRRPNKLLLKKRAKTTTLEMDVEDQPDNTRSAWTLADRYCGSVQRLRDHQSRWRQRHDVLMERKRQEEAMDGDSMQSTLRQNQIGTENTGRGSVSKEILNGRTDTRKSVHPALMRKVLNENGAGNTSDRNPSFGMEEEDGENDESSESGLGYNESEDTDSDDDGTEGDEDQGGERRQTNEWEVTEVHAGCVSALKQQGSIVEKTGADGAAVSAAVRARRASNAGGETPVARGRSSVGLRSSLSKANNLDSSNGSNGIVDELAGSSDGLAAKQRYLENRNRPKEKDALRLAKKYRLQVWEVRDCLEEFNKLDPQGTGKLQKGQFLNAVRNRLAAPGDNSEIPEQILKDVWRTIESDGDELIDFEEFVAWTQTVAFTADLVVANPEERNIRTMAKNYELSIPDVERIWREYHLFDTDHDGKIDKSEFKVLLSNLLNAADTSEIPSTRLDRFWMAAETSGDGTISFPEFLSWYKKYFMGAQSGSCAASTVYRKLGEDRLTHFHKAQQAQAQAKAQVLAEANVAKKNARLSLSSMVLTQTQGQLTLVQKQATIKEADEIKALKESNE